MRNLLAGLALFALCGAGQAVADEAAAMVRLNRAITVSGDVIRLGDIFAGLTEKGDLPVARAPAPGQGFDLQPRWLAALAQQQGIAWQPSSMLDIARVERASIEFGSEDIQDLVAAEIAEAFGDGAVLSIHLDNPAASLSLPAESVEDPRLARLRHDSRNGRFTATLVHPASGTPRLRLAVTGRIHEMVELPVLQRRVAADEVIDDDDIGWMQVRADRIDDDVVHRPSGMIGKSPRRSLRAGQPVRGKDLREPRLVDKNALVTLRLQLPYMRLTTQGRALEDGSLGDTVRVMNTKSNTVIHGVVTGTNLIDVSAGSPSVAMN